MRADALEVGDRGVIAGQEQVIAVVDGQAELLVEIGPTTPAGHARGFVDDDAATFACKRCRRGETGEARAHDMNEACQKKPQRSAAPINLSL